LCGIAGFTHRKRPAPPGRIQSVIATLSHRGPDYQGVFESGAVSLGAARLKIIDLAGGDQPMKSPDGDSVIAFNGEIYNHLELRRELESLGHRFESRTDTETALAAFLEWDTQCFSRMRGMFAIALWTESSQRLVLARDRLGIKPLYLARRGEDLFFGSELKTLFAHPEMDRNLSLAGLDSYLSLNYAAGTSTLVEGIEKLPQGHWLEWRAGKTRSECYWHLRVGPTPGDDRTWTAPAAEAELDRLLKLSMKEHLVADVPLGVWLSGGVDSSTLLHYAAEASGSRLKTFSISFRGRSFDETRFIRQVAARYHTEHEELDLNPDRDLTGAIEQFAYYSDEPNADAGALPVWFLSKMTKRSATVALSGEGADELFGGYLTQRASLLARRFRRLPEVVLRCAAQCANRWPVSDEKISFEYKLKRFLEGCRMPAARAHAFWGGTFSDREKQLLVRTQLPGAFHSTLDRLSEAGDTLAAYLWFDQKYYLPDDVLTKVDRMSMAHSLEVRPPFLDHRLVEFANSLPARLKIDGARQKVVLKNLVRNKLPGEILSRRKEGFDIPAHDWLRGPLRPLLLAAVEFARAEHAGLFRMARIDALVEAHLERRANLGYHLWGLVILFLWMKQWRIQTAPLAEPARRRKMESVFDSI
jgi:asparagine synthase (glutamine-hydrolysing)